MDHSYVLCVFGLCFRYVTYTSREEEHNLVVFQFYRHIYYRVSQPITEGTELRVLIGRDYATLLGLGMGEFCQSGLLPALADLKLIIYSKYSATI